MDWNYVHRYVWKPGAYHFKWWTPTCSNNRQGVLRLKDVDFTHLRVSKFIKEEYPCQYIGVCLAVAAVAALLIITTIIAPCLYFQGKRSKPETVFYVMHNWKMKRKAHKHWYKTVIPAYTFTNTHYRRRYSSSLYMLHYKFQVYLYLNMQWFDRLMFVHLYSYFILYNAKKTCSNSGKI